MLPNNLMSVLPAETIYFLDNLTDMSTAYPIETIVAVGDVPDEDTGVVGMWSQGPITDLYAMQNERRWVLVYSESGEAPDIAVQTGVGTLLELFPLGTTAVYDVARYLAGDGTHYTSYYDAVSASEYDGHWWVLGMTAPGAGQYPVRINGYWINLWVTDKAMMPEIPTLPTAFGTHADYPVDGGNDGSQKSHDWFISQPEYRDPDGTMPDRKNDGYVRVYQALNNRQQKSRQAPYQWFYDLWLNGDGIPMTGQDFYDCERKRLAYPESAILDMQRWGGRFRSQAMGGYHFKSDRSPGVWALCGIRQDRITVAAGSRIPGTNPPQYYTVEAAAALTEQNLNEWLGHLADYYTAWNTFTAEHSLVDIWSFCDEPVEWDDESWERLKWTTDAAWDVGHTWGITVPNSSILEDCLTYDIKVHRWICHINDYPNEMPTDDQLERLPQPYDLWGYITFDDASMINRKDGNRSHPSEGGGTAEDLVIICFERGLKGLLRWSTLQPNTYWSWNFIDHWYYLLGAYSRRVLWWEQALVLHDWLVAAADHLGADGQGIMNKVLSGYVSSLTTNDETETIEIEYRGEALRAWLYDLMEETEPEVPEETLDEWTIRLANAAQCISPNPYAALQKAAYARDMIVTSNELVATYPGDGKAYVIQRGEHMTTPQEPTAFRAEVGHYDKVDQIPILQEIE